MSEREKVRERPILFGGEMVRAILDGRKTQTRRVVKWPEWIEDRQMAAYWFRSHPCAALYEDGRAVRRFCCPYGVLGDRLWVRETHVLFPGIAGADRPVYRADGEMPKHVVGIRWRPSIFMPRWASRITLEVTDVKVDRVQEITEEDAIAEGIETYPGYHRQRFRDAWNVLHRKRACGWDMDPYVWVVSFDVIQAVREAAS